MNHLLDDNELLDLVDEHDHVIGSLERSKVYEKKLNNFRVINVFLINPQGQLWIPRRSAHKRLCPLQLDVGVGGHVSSGETYDQAFAREMMEEVCLDVTTLQYQVLGTMTPAQYGVTAFLQIYKVLINEAPAFNRDDFVEYFWLTPDELLKKIAVGDKAKSDVPLMVKNFIHQLIKRPD
jgi:isopentenyl-diphosphate delta-isomerase